MTVDITFCASPNCVNECCRQMNSEQHAFLFKFPSKPVYYAYFCGEPHEMSENIKIEIVPMDTNND